MESSESVAGTAESKTHGEQDHPVEQPAKEPARTRKASSIAFQVRAIGEKRNLWDRIGANFEHNDGKGSTVLLDILPLDGRFVVRRQADPEGREIADPTAEVPAEVAAAGKRRPDEIAYSIRTATNGNEYWTEIGVAYRNKDGRGKSVRLHAFPRDHRVVFREFTVKVAKEPQTVEASNATETAA